MSTDISAIRRRNLLTLRTRYRTKRDLAQAAGMNYAHMIQMCAGPPTGRGIGEQAARKMECNLALPAGWLDRPESEAEGSTSTFARQVQQELAGRDLPQHLQDTILYLVRTIQKSPQEPKP